MTVPSISSVLPFVAMLLAIAVCPLWIPHWWESNRNKLIASAVLGLPVLATYGIRHRGTLLHTAEDYVSFIVLLAGLFVVSGGIRLRGDLLATPATNTTFLAIGGVLASAVGTTGASMLLVRALLQTNSQRTRVKHTLVFFIFIVSNVGGMLTPLGDPPLFLGYLAGVPFTWTFRLWPQWLLLLGALLATFFVYDSVQFGHEPLSAVRRDRTQTRLLRLDGGLNALGLGGIVLAVALLPAPWREAAIVALGALSLWLTPARIRRDNAFSWGPMVEVAVLFAGIFVTMIPALELLRLRGGELGVQAPWQFFWASGLLSSFLDNAPTYLAFLALGQGLRLPGEIVGVPAAILAAISVGSVAMGANTYIGNAPNFMVKAIAEEAGVKMPGFFGYMLYSGAVLIPLFVVVTLLFFR
ncbi:MAG TPA: sodium:proton antiporter [Methylomirabilota bacterium]|jgi:Na+/H+ antiporter NhaD/arsenite permease-like protein|nr:sodium:proton antiporter [Methylomirabilota bacterium]